MNLRLKLAFNIALFAVLCCGVVSMLSYVSEKASVEHDAAESVSSIVKSVYAIAALSARQKNDVLAKHVVDGLVLNNEIACATIRTVDQVTLAAAHHCDGAPSLVRTLRTPESTNQSIGELEIHKDIYYINHVAREHWINELRAVVMVVVFICFAILFANYYLIAKPIEKISRQLRKVRFEQSISLLEEGARSDELGSIARSINFMLISAKKQIIGEKILSRRSQELATHFKLIFELSKNYLAVTDGELRLKSFNPKFKELMSLIRGDEELTNKNDWITYISEENDFLLHLIDSVNEAGVPTTTEVEISYHNGETLIHNFFNLTFVKSDIQGQDENILFFIYDMTEHRRHLLEKEYEASHDNLTKLLNRMAATKRVRHMLGAVTEDEQIAILFIDLDGFKLINDELGHDAGDDILRVVATRLKASIRKTDLACRWGGDEFLLALHGLSVPEAMTLAHKILGKIQVPIHISSIAEERCVGASIGLVVSTPDTHDFSTLFDRADRAMYRVKKSGKSAVLMHSS